MEQQVLRNVSYSLELIIIEQELVKQNLMLDGLEERIDQTQTNGMLCFIYI